MLIYRGYTLNGFDKMGQILGCGLLVLSYLVDEYKNMGKKVKNPPT